MKSHGNITVIKSQLRMYFYCVKTWW